MYPAQDILLRRFFSIDTTLTPSPTIEIISTLSGAEQALFSSVLGKIIDQLCEL